MSGIDFFIPEVTQSTRRGAAKSKLVTARSLAAQTPPLKHFTENLHSDIVASASNTGRTTPDWQPSQRSESEARELVKRKLGPRKKKVVKEPIKKTHPPKKSKMNADFLKLAKKVISSKIRSASSSFNSIDSDSD